MSVFGAPGILGHDARSSEWPRWAVACHRHPRRLHRRAAPDRHTRAGHRSRWRAAWSQTVHCCFCGVGPPTPNWAGYNANLLIDQAAYVESYIRALRRGRSRFSGSFGLTLSAAALAVAVVGAVWVLMGRELTMATLVGCAVLAAGAEVAATIGSLRIGRKYRYRRARRAQQRALR